MEALCEEYTHGELGGYVRKFFIRGLIFEFALEIFHLYFEQVVPLDAC